MGMSRRAVPVRILLLVFALAGSVADPVLHICRHPASHDGHGHAAAPMAAHGDRHRPEADGHDDPPIGDSLASRSMRPVLAAADGAHGASAGLGGDRPSIPSHHDDHLACFAAILQPHPTFLLDLTRALEAPVSLTDPSLLALGPATPPP